MKHMLPLLFMLALSSFSCQQNNSNQQTEAVVNQQNTPASANTAAVTPVELPGEAPKRNFPDNEKPDFSITAQGVSGGMAYLIANYTDQRYRVDSTTANAQGKMTFKRSEPYESGLYYINFPNNQGYIQLLLDQDQSFSMATTTTDPTGDMQVKGSTENEILYQNLKFEGDLQNKFQATQDPNQRAELVNQRKAHLEQLFTKYPNTLFTSYKKAAQNPDVREVADKGLQVKYYREDFWSNVDFSDTRLLHTPVISNKLTRFINELTVQHPDSINAAADFMLKKVAPYPEYFQFFANWITLNYEPTETTLMDPEAVYVHMIQNYFTKERAFWASDAEVQGLQQRAFEMANSLVGGKAPDVKAPGPDGKEYAISSIKSDYIIVYLYNPECEHCMEETPKLVNFYREWKSKGVEVYAIAIDTDDKKWKDYIKKNNMNWINVFDPTNRSIYAKYFVNLTPEVYVVNPERTIIAKNLKVSQIEEVIRRDQNK